MGDPTLEGKRAAGRAAADLVQDGMRVGLGTGSTFVWALERLAERLQAGLRFAGVPTSEATAKLARELGVPLLDLDKVEALDLVIDGADEVDRHKNLIKGGGGALVREKIVAAAGRELVVVVSADKLVERLGAFPLPVECLQFGSRHVTAAIERLGGRATLRRAKDGAPFVSDNGNFILDCRFAAGIGDPAALEMKLNLIPGVLDCGLFVGRAGRVFVGDASGQAREL